MTVDTDRGETREFKAETKKLLDIVINSLYTERDIFVRELISNSADALEKFRHISLLEKPEFDSHVPLEITIDCDDKKNTLTITDTGIGMNKEELEKNLGTIAHSGSNSFFEGLAEAAKKDISLIGQFGVGFYSVFMAAKNVRVQTRSWDGSEGHEWESDGGPSYKISPVEGLHRGTKIILELKDDAKDYGIKFTVERIIQQYSSFVTFPIKVEGKTVNTIQALWTRQKSEITDDEYNEFYKFVANAMDEPLLRLHFSVDAPLAINALLYVPKENYELIGMGRLQPGVNLYCRKILIDQHSKNILPDWLRFLKGVVDSEDLPLNISRQNLQDSSLVMKLRRVLTKRFLKMLKEKAAEDAPAYMEFWKTFGIFLKEGVTSDFEYQQELAPLLRFESSESEEGSMISLDDYVERMKDGQDSIYYINGPSRGAVENGPYVEMFKKRNVEILYTLEPIDDFVLNHIREYRDKKLVSADRADLALPDTGSDNTQSQADKSGSEKLAKEKAEPLLNWMKEVLGDRVKDVVKSSRLVDSPAMIVNADGYMTSSMERILQAASKDEDKILSAKKNLEINTANPLIRKLSDLQEKDRDFAVDVLEQIFDNAMIQAGLLVDPMKMVNRNYRILERMANET